ncbi:MAG: hypothetical protein J6V70_00170 [Kiritimatiellae bacterium]|nr:hypothetical protein [Kiritimatiellia bacterium]
MAKKSVNEVRNGDIKSNIVVLRSVWGKRGQKYYIQPQKDSKGQYPACVRKVNSDGDMILKAGDDPDFLIPEDRIFTIQDGTTFNLNDPYQAVEWQAIENCFLIAPSRFAKDANGNYLIDGTPDVVTNSNYGARSRYGRAELYVERPGLEAQQKVTRAKLELQATNYIYQFGYEDWLTFAKVLGRNMENQPLPDVEYFLISVAKKTPEKIIEICSGGDLANRVLFITAKEHGVIRKKNGMYIYGEDGDLILGASEEAVIDWMRQPKNKKTLELIRKDAYPDMQGID